MRTIPLYAGEFGLEIRFRVPKVYAVCRREPCSVRIEAGKEALYPAAAEWRIVEREPEDTLEASRARGRRGRPKVRGPEERFVPEPHVTQGVGALGAIDVFICPRKRGYVSQKNWPHWQALDRLLRHGYGLNVFAGGVADASDTSVGCAASWYYDRPLDACIEAMRQAKLVVAPCSGLAHLAMLCGAPLLIFTYRGLDAPGPVITSSGRKTRDKRWPVRFEEYYEAANHTDAPLSQVDGWEHPERIAGRVARELGVAA